MTRVVTKSTPACWFLPPSLLAAYGASRFHLAEPGAQRTRGDDLDAGLEQVVPVLDVLRLPLRTTSDHRTEQDALRDVGVPLRRDLAGLHQARDVGFDGEVDDVGGLAVHHGPGLVAGGAVGGGDRDTLAVGVAANAGMILLQPGSHRVGHQGQGGVGVGPATAGDVTLAPPPQAASTVAVAAIARDGAPAAQGDGAGMDMCFSGLSRCGCPGYARHADEGVQQKCHDHQQLRTDRGQR